VRDGENIMTGLVETYRGTVYPWQCDHMNHMNIMWYVGKFDEANWQFFAMLGLTPSFLRDQGRGMAAVDQRIVYRRELHAGDVVSIRSGVLEAREKVMRFVHEMRNDAVEDVAAVTILTAVHLDRQVGKASPFPVDVLARMRERVVPYDLAGLDPVKHGKRHET
jgi:acyl-CoA thioester hydrolase